MTPGYHVTLHKIAENPDAVDSLVGMSNFMENDERAQPHTNWSVIDAFCGMANANLIPAGQRMIDHEKTTIGSSHVYERRPYTPHRVIS
ncbi:hypothetical protein [Kutzneria chonburiensis]|uniref:Uncharacterized protein n=1 Tax=Kutzneria chonburiensis TaxID=1483604 RepID=A0ABV6MRG6_9PSEU|nr:hypothetical protein [Kutzneria chonburiensis]